MMKLVQLFMKKPSDSQIRTFKIIIGLLLFTTWLLIVGVQELKLKDSLFGIMLHNETKTYLLYALALLGVPSLVFGGLDINILSRGRARIAQILFGILLIIVSSFFVDTASISADILYMLIGIVVLIAGIIGKTTTTKGQRYGQKITKIRV